MKPQGIHRFSWGEQFFHWANAGLYLVLFLTGILLLMGRIFSLQSLSYDVLSKIHRICGVMLVGLLTVILVLSVSVPTFRELWKTLRQCLKWSRQDVLWLLKVPVNMVTPRCSLPPAGRFNPGQKMHLLVVFSALLGLSISGLAMILIPGALGAWAIHLACFVPVLIFLSLHLFLSLINPETRKALPAIWTGFIDADYASSHHALWDAVPQGAPMHGSYVSWKWVCLVGMLGLVAVGIAVGQHGFNASAHDLRILVKSRGASAILPGPLCAAHGLEEELQTCRACHSVTRPIQNQACVACHEIIAERLAVQSGFHGTLNGPCRECHAEHQGPDASLIDLEVTDFTHAKTLFPLEGRHLDADCEGCHVTEAQGFRYIGIDFSACVICHEDPHQDEQAALCQECHTPDTWQYDGKVFDHAAETSFALKGKHAPLDCQACHQTPGASEEASRIQLFDLGNACADCHQDPHLGQFLQACEQCHVEDDFEAVRAEQFHGDPYTFLLKGKHAQLLCQACHVIPEGQSELAQAQFVGLGQGCADCHLDPHQARMDHACEICHQEEGFAGANLLFVHDQHTSFKLDGQHKALQCDTCHESGDLLYEAAGVECQDCHASYVQALAGQATSLKLDPDPHFNRLACIDCHDLSTPEQSKAQFAARCAECHTPHYEALFENWQASLSRQQNILTNRVNQAPLTPALRESLHQRLQEASRIGFHHMTLAQELLEQLPQDIPHHDQ
jgi:cytochrome b subunit of formate dehydrogenase